MMQHPTAINIIKRAIFGRQIDKGSGDKGDVLFQIAALDPGLGNGAGAFREIDINDFRLGFAVTGLLGQHDQGIPGAATGDQNFDFATFGLCRWIAPAKDKMNNFIPIARRAADQALILVFRISCRIGIGFILITRFVRRRR